MLKRANDKKKVMRTAAEGGCIEQRGKVDELEEEDAALIRKLMIRRGLEMSGYGKGSSGSEEEV